MGNYEGNSSSLRRNFCKQMHMVELLSPRTHGLKGNTSITPNWCMTVLPCEFVYKNFYEGNSSYLCSSPPVQVNSSLKVAAYPRLPAQDFRKILFIGY